jgi:hypothetical protein
MLQPGWQDELKTEVNLIEEAGTRPVFCQFRFVGKLLLDLMLSVGVFLWSKSAYNIFLLVFKADFSVCDLLNSKTAQCSKGYQHSER